MEYDCAIIGGGPAGLHTATYLGRFDRSVVVFHGGKPRAEWIPTTYNFPACPEGIKGVDILRQMRRQAEKYRVKILHESVLSVTDLGGHFQIHTSGSDIQSRTVVFATGVFDIPPDIPNAEHYKGRTIRHCPVCDAYESRGRRTVVIGPPDRASHMAIWLSHFTDDLTILTNGPPDRDDFPEDLLTRIDELGIKVMPGRIEAIQEYGRLLGTVFLEGGERINNVFRGYSAMGLKPNNEVAAAMGVELDPDGYIKVDSDQQTSIPGVYAVGDIAGGDIAQLNVAIGHAATAATAIHNSLNTE